MATGEACQKKRNNYKLLVDPELKKGHKKVYRINGKDEPGFPSSGFPKDPRTQKTVLGVTGSSVDFKLPRFKYDKHWVGDPPERDVFIIGLNEGVKGSLLKEACVEVAPIYSIKFHRHPKTKTFLGAATVSFVRSGSGRSAVSELDGKILGGCYMRAELDDGGEHLKKYLEPVLKKCELENRGKQGRDVMKEMGLENSDVEEVRSRNNSVTESGHELSESETEPSSTATPLTPTLRKNSDPFLAPTATKLYPFSSLHVLSPASVTPEPLPSPSIGSSPGLRTPLSIDSGISLRTSSLPSPRDSLRTKQSKPGPIPPLPPEEGAPPLPPQELEGEPPPLPPLPPTPATDQGGIENISSDEEEVPTANAFHSGKNGLGSNAQVDLLSPVSVSPPSSPKVTSTAAGLTYLPPATSTCLSAVSQINPALGLQSLLLGSRTSSASTSTAAPALSSQYIAVSPTPTPGPSASTGTASYELEVEEISGDESPVMVFNFDDLEVESVSDEGAGDDMEVCSDDENAQDTVIEINVRASRPSDVYPLHGPRPAPLPGMLGLSSDPRIHPPPSFPLGGPRVPLPPPRPPPNFFPPPPLQPPPPGPFPPPLSRPPPGPPPPFPPGLPPLHTRAVIQPPFDIPPHSSYQPRMPNGFVDYPSPPSFDPGPGSVSKPRRSSIPPPKTKQDSLSKEVLEKALEQLKMILLNDVQKKLVEAYAYCTLDNFWEKKEKEKLPQKSGADQPSGVTAADGKPVRQLEPYRSMLPGLKLEKEKGKEGREEEDEEDEEEDDKKDTSLPTPRKKRLMNFKIPLINRGGQRRDQNLPVVTRRRLFSEEDEEEPPKKVTTGVAKKSYFPSGLSDISSAEDFSSGESEEEEEEEEEEMVEEEEEEEWEAELSGESSGDDDHDKDYRDIFGASSSEDEAPIKTPVRPCSSPVTEEVEPEQESVIKDDVTIQQVPSPQRKPSVITEENSEEPKEDQPQTPLVADSLPVPKKEQTVQDKESLSRVKAFSLKVEKVSKPLPPATPKHKFKKRSAPAEEEVMKAFATGGLDREDVQMFKLALSRIIASKGMEAVGVLWAYYPHIPMGPPPTKRRRTERVDDHASGCARSEGYYKIDPRDKVKYLPHHKTKKEFSSLSTRGSKKKPTSSGRVNRANQRRLASVFSTADISSDLAKYNQLRARKKLLKFAKSAIHNWGLFAMEDIAADEMVIEYVGQMVRLAVADERERRYEAAGIGSSYLFRVDHDYIIDATRNGNLARFINHCCDPNCYAKVISFGTQKKIIIYSKRDIKLGEEITYDYKFPIEDDKIPCLCGAPNCRGTLN